MLSASDGGAGLGRLSLGRVNAISDSLYRGYCPRLTAVIKPHGPVQGIVRQMIGLQNFGAQRRIQEAGVGDARSVSVGARSRQYQARRPTMIKSRSTPSSSATRGSLPQCENSYRANRARLGALWPKMKPSSVFTPIDGAQATASVNK